MTIDDLTHQLSIIDDLELWSRFLRNVPEEHRETVKKGALPRWLERRTLSGELLFHPDVLLELQRRNWIPAPEHLQMVWSNILASLTGSDSRHAFARIKKKIIKTHGDDWWEAVYRRIKPTYAARQRLLRHSLGMGTALQVFAQRSTFFGGLVRAEQVEALQMIPRH